MANYRRNVRILGLIILIIGAISTIGLFIVMSQGKYSWPDNAYDHILVSDVWVWDGDSLLNEGEPLSVRISDGRIDCIAENCESPEGTHIIDGKGKTLMPGLIDLHMTFFSPAPGDSLQGNFSLFINYVKIRPDLREKLVQSGITTLLSVGDPNKNVGALKQELNNFQLAGPTIRTASPLFIASGAYPADSLFAENDFLLQEALVTLNSVEEAIAACRTWSQKGVNHIYVNHDDLGKGLPVHKQEVLEAIASEAEKFNIPLIVRIGDQKALEQVWQAGFREIVWTARGPLKEAWIDTLAIGGATVFPALTHKTDKAIFSEQVPLFTRRGLRLGNASGFLFDTQNYFLPDELMAWKKLGIAEKDILKSATSNAARVLRTDDQNGRIEVGKQGEVLVIQGRIWENISAIKEIDVVIRAGTVLMENGEIIK